MTKWVSLKMSSIGKQLSWAHVSFVRASPTVEISGHSSTSTEGNLCGDEVRNFYHEVISSPSATTTSPPCPVTKASRVNKKPSYEKYSKSRITVFQHAHLGDIKGIEYYLSKGGDVNDTDIFGWTPLMCAVAQNQLECAEFLIRNGSDKRLKNKQGQTALDVAVLKNHHLMVQLLEGNSYSESQKTFNSATVQDEIKHCEVCKCTFKGPVMAHKSSIPHLLNEKRKSSDGAFYHLPESNKGFQIMLRKGWDKNRGLGPNAQGTKFPVKTVLKTDRTCIGLKKEKAKITHFGPNDYNSVKTAGELDKRPREKTYKKWALKKMQQKTKQKEIDFRREFSMIE